MVRELPEPPKDFSDVNELKRFYSGIRSRKKVRENVKDVLRIMEWKRLPPESLRYICLNGTLTVFKDPELAYKFIEGTKLDDAPRDVTMNNLERLMRVLNVNRPRKLQRTLLNKFGLKEVYSHEVEVPNRDKKATMVIYANTDKGYLLTQESHGRDSLNYEFSPIRIVKPKDMHYLENRIYSILCDDFSSRSNFRNKKRGIIGIHISMRRYGPYHFRRLEQLEESGVETNGIWTKYNPERVKIWCRGEKYPDVVYTNFIHDFEYDLHGGVGSEGVVKLENKRIEALPEDVRIMIGAAEPKPGQKYKVAF